VAVSVAIIDCLQRWTLVKKAAEVVKVLEFNRATVAPKPYGERFLRHLSQRFVPTDAPLPCLLTSRGSRRPLRHASDPTLGSKNVPRSGEESPPDLPPKRAESGGAILQQAPVLSDSEPEETSSWWAGRIRTSFSY
jgi:hypothetical protein